RQVSALATSVVGIEEEGAVLDALEKHHPRRHTLFARCRESHRVGLQRPGGGGLAKPPVEERERVARRLRLEERHLARAFLWHVLAQLFQGGALQPRDVHLTDPEAARDL